MAPLSVYLRLGRVSNLPTVWTNVLSGMLLSGAELRPAVFALLAAAIFGGGVAHVTVGPALRIADVAPDIPLIVVVLLALRRGPEFGCAAGSKSPSVVGQP